MFDENLDVEVYHYTGNSEDVFYFVDSPQLMGAKQISDDGREFIIVKDNDANIHKVYLGDFIIRCESGKIHVIPYQTFKDWVRQIATDLNEGK